MTGSFNGKLGRWMARSAFGAFLALAVVPAAQAQWLLPLGAASPGEIVQRLQAQGYRLTGPLYRRNSVYLADVIAGPAGRERLIIDAWSGEILQRFVVRRGHWRRGFGGEFAEPMAPGVFGPPPASDFSDDRPARASEQRNTPRAAPRPTAASRQPPETAPAAGATSPEKPRDAEINPGAPAPAPLVSPPAAAASAAPSEAVSPNAPSSASSSAETKAAAPPPPAVTAKTPNADAAAGARLETKPAPSGASARTEAQSAQAASRPPAPVPFPKSKGKSKVNDVPVMPLD
jgi:hypothetical protein